MPRREVRTHFGTPYWQCGEMVRLYQGDCLRVFKKVPSACADLVFIDPPFNVGHPYDAYQDDKDEKEYFHWCTEWLSECRRVIKPYGSIYLASGVRHQARLHVILGKVGFYFRNTVCWHYTFGPAQKGNFTPSWVALHYFTADPSKWTWNPDQVRVPSARQLKYDDRRANPVGKVPDNVWVLLPQEYEVCFRPWMNSWLESRVCGTFKARTDHPCQMPEGVLERIIKVSSNPGDLVLDPMMGSCTTGAAAVGLGRKFLGIELSEKYTKDICIPRIKARLAELGIQN